MKNLCLLALVSLLVSCNLYSPFRGKSSNEDYLEEAQKCLHDGNYDCAIENYNALPDGEVKSQKLCLVHLSKGGLRLTTLINTIKSSSGTMLGELAQAMSPWNANKGTAFESAKTHCASYAAFATSSGTGVLLKTLAYFGDCALRMAKTDVYVATSNSDTTCNTPSPTADGLVRRSDFGPSTGAISSSSPGMCVSDLSVCLDDLSKVSSSELNSAGMGDIVSANNGISEALRNGSTANDSAANTARSTLRGESIAD